VIWVLRDTMGLLGTKYGCGIAQCGACTVHIDGAPARSCALPVSAVADKHITTIEGLGRNGALHPVQQAWLDLDVPQCGYCQSGMMMPVPRRRQTEPQPGGARADAACLPLRHFRAHRRRAPRRGGRARNPSETAVTRPRLDRRAFLASVAGAGGSLVLGFDIQLGPRATHAATSAREITAWIVI